MINRKGFIALPILIFAAAVAVGVVGYFGWPATEEKEIPFGSVDALKYLPLESPSIEEPTLMKVANKEGDAKSGQARSGREKQEVVLYGGINVLLSDDGLYLDGKLVDSNFFKKYGDIQPADQILYGEDFGCQGDFYIDRNSREEKGEADCYSNIVVSPDWRYFGFVIRREVIPEGEFYPHSEHTLFLRYSASGVLDAVWELEADTRDGGGLLEWRKQKGITDTTAFQDCFSLLYIDEGKVICKVLSEKIVPGFGLHVFDGPGAPSKTISGSAFRVYPKVGRIIFYTDYTDGPEDSNCHVFNGPNTFNVFDIKSVSVATMFSEVDFAYYPLNFSSDGTKMYFLLQKIDEEGCLPENRDDYDGFAVYDFRSQQINRFFGDEAVANFREYCASSSDADCSRAEVFR